MQNSLILCASILGCVLLFNSYTSGQQFTFPVQACATGVATGNYWSCAGQLAFNIWKVHNWGANTPITICGLPCTGNLKGRISKLQWVWDARFRCDSNAPGINGKSSKKSRDGAMEWAIKDFLNQALSSGRLKSTDLRC
ncbi:unnamed protein product [Rotaria magnacalcarata]|uniref:Uncharacterized protein n=2 Tax=Rotaria magnacalcarata TaxID=392030 RepID=A0A816MA32_9BILA|nr:unnamed protein product [Rotaria magnacalcarata]CAF2057582.1 unnamed protein product [Rotaria magnacalcarata]CAF3981711.1 unnamed protein product [Rotaria magnacalcarata]CAF3985129.1 unnamed protein product [Rotaria magnacalcarata]